MVPLLLDGADANIQNEVSVIAISSSHLLSLQDGWTPIHWACFKGRDKMASLLLEKGADINIQNKVSHYSRLSHCDPFLGR
jgi:ankyrin repeat protein